MAVPTHVLTTTVIYPVLRQHLCRSAIVGSMDGEIQDNIRHINWDNLYHINQSQEENPTYGAGHRAINMIEERHADQLDWNLYTQFSHLFRDNSKITVV